MVCSRDRAGNMPVFISLWFCGPKGSAARITRNPGHAAAMLASGPWGQQPGLAIRIVASVGTPAGVWRGRAETARPVHESNGPSPVLAGIRRRYRPAGACSAPAAADRAPGRERDPRGLTAPGGPDLQRDAPGRRADQEVTPVQRVAGRAVVGR